MFNFERVFNPTPRRKTRDTMPEPLRPDDLSLDASLAQLPIGPSMNLEQDGANDAPAYTYKPLGEGGIRILEFREQPDTESFRARLIHVGLNSVAKCYTAISYCWGPKDISRSLTLDGGFRLPISQVVEDLLRHIVKDKVMFLWIDAICIDQADDNDKSRQIQLMRDIYAMASETVVWLGQPSAQARLWRYLHSYEDKLSWRNYVDEILEMLSAPWFERVWVIQEVACGKEVRVLFGGISMSWDYFCELNSYFNAADVLSRILVDPEHFGRRQTTLRAFATPARFMRLLMIVRSNIDHASRSPYLAMALNDLDCFLIDTRLHQATDPRDKVYALLGIVNPASRHLITPDYANDSVDSAFREAAALSYKRGKLALLGLCGTCIPRKSLKFPFTPSWVPDLTVSLPGTVWSTRYDDYKTAWARLPASVDVIERTLSLLDDERRLWIIPQRMLSIVGLITDTIAGVCTEPPLYLDPAEMYSYTIYITPSRKDYKEQLVRETLKLCNTLQPYPSGNEYTAERVCWRTLTADLDGTHGGADVDFFSKAFELYLKIDESEEGAPPTYEEQVMLVRLERAMKMAGGGAHRRVFWTKGGYVGLARDGIQEGDSIALLRGACVPFILRRADMSGYIAVGEQGEPKGAENGIFKVVCEGYVCGMMDDFSPAAAKDTLLLW